MALDLDSLGFASGTSIQTPDGPLPIEQIRVGMQVLAQPEAGGERAYRSVLNTVTHLDKEVYAVQVKVAGADSLTTLFATGGHPFWVEAPLVDSAHWMATECLEPGFVLQLADGSKATVHAAGLIRQTQFREIGFAADARAGVGIVLDLSARQAKLASDAVALKLGRLEVGEPWLTPVYNFEVEEFHTYYVGEVGVWVHNTECKKEVAIEATMDKAKFEPIKKALEDACFVYDTPVWVLDEDGKEILKEIQWVTTRDMVYSRNEFTGEHAYRKVVETFTHDNVPVYELFYYPNVPGGEERIQLPIRATAAHRFWVEGKGWTALIDIQPGDVITCIDDNSVMVDSVTETGYSTDVYNLSVEEYHTYFVGLGLLVHSTKEKPVRVEQAPVTTPDTNGSQTDVAIEATLDKASFEKTEKALEDACFVYDTPVWVLDEDDKEILKEIQWVTTRDMVYSRNEFTGEHAYRKVLKKFRHDDVPIYDLFYYANIPSGKQTTEVPITATAAHRFWVEGKGWTALIDIQPGDVITCIDDNSVTVDSVTAIGYNTDVYNLSVEEYHTYFVGLGLWVHSTKEKSVEVEQAPVTTPDTNGSQTDVAVEATLDKAEKIIPCFDGDTLVQTQLGYCDIEHLEVGDMVLSRCEITGEQGYRRVLKKFEHECAESYVVYFEKKNKLGDVIYEDDSAVYTTAEHPFWVNGIGWVPASELLPGHELEIVDPIDVGDEYRAEGQKKTQLALSGGRWQAKVTKVEIRNNVRQYAGETYLRTVFNIEVEEFHTYFVDWGGIWVHDKSKAEAAILSDQMAPITASKGSADTAEKLTQKYGSVIVEGNPIAPDTGGTRVRQTDLEAAGFDGETKVVVENGELEDIQYIDVGRLVLSRCEKTGETAYRKVLKNHRRYHVPVYDLWCWTVGGFNEQPILTTAEHPFWVKGKGWTPAIKLQPGDVLANKDGTQTSVRKLEKKSYFSDVHSLEVVGFNTYFVGEYGYWVHDCNSPELSK